MTMILTEVRRRLSESATRVHDQLLWSLCRRRDPSLPEATPTTELAAIEALGHRLTGHSMPATGWTYWSLDNRPLADIGPFVMTHEGAPGEVQTMRVSLNYRVR